MSGPVALKLPGKSLAAVLSLLTLTFFLRAWAEHTQTYFGVDAAYFRYWADFLLVPLLSWLVWLVIRREKEFVHRLFARSALTFRAFATGVAVGILAMSLWWAQLTARVAFGLQHAQAPDALDHFAFSMACPDWQILAMAAVTWLFLVPISEEFIHRGVILSGLAGRGPAIALIVSTLIFTAMHSGGSYIWIAFMGLVMGIAYWNSSALWLPIAIHASYDGLVAFDNLCLGIRWNPAGEYPPLHVAGIAGIVVTLVSAAGILFLVSQRWIGPVSRARSGQV
jgi:membrane protease YdiL (CAAX protease family)